MRIRSGLSATILLFALAGCSAVGGASTDEEDFVVDTPKTELLAAWTQFVAVPTGSKTPYSPKKPFPVEAPNIELRFVTSSKTGNGANCANFWVAHTDSSGTAGITQKLFSRTNPRSSDFLIDVCTLPLDNDWTEVRIIPKNGKATDPGLPITEKGVATGVIATMPGPHKLGRRKSGGGELNLVTLGDSGCKDSHGQDCTNKDPNKPLKWPLEKIANSAAKTAPDLVVHTGDYRYRGGHIFQRSESWSYWLEDLLAPARKLLVTAPWAFSRGNHEQCDSSSNGSAGPGFFYLLGPNSGGQVNWCLNDISPAWYFDIAPDGIDGSGAPTAPHRFVMIDSSFHRSSLLPGQFSIATQASVLDSVWWVTHIPPIDRLHYNNQHGDRHVKDAMKKGLSASVNASFKLCDKTRSGKPSCSPSTLLLAHDHMWQTVTFERSGKYIFPQSYIVGHGGVEPRGAGLSASPCKSYFNLPNGEGHHGIVRYASKHGYVSWNRSKQTVASQNGWNPKEIWIDGVAPSQPGSTSTSC